MESFSNCCDSIFSVCIFEWRISQLFSTGITIQSVSRSKCYLGQSASANKYFAGNIDSFQYWSIQLTDTQITALFQQTVPFPILNSRLVSGATFMQLVTDVSFPTSEPFNPSVTYYMNYTGNPTYTPVLIQQLIFVFTQTSQTATYNWDTDTWKTLGVNLQAINSCGVSTSIQSSTTWLPCNSNICSSSQICQNRAGYQYVCLTPSSSTI